MTDSKMTVATGDQLTVVLMEIQELLASVRHTGDTFFKACASVFATFIAVSTGVIIYADTILGRGSDPRDPVLDPVLRVWGVIVAILIMIVMGFLIQQGLLNHYTVNKRVRRLKERIQVLNDIVGSPAHLKLDPRLFTLQAYNGIYMIAAGVISTFGLAWVGLVLWAVVTR